MFGLSSNTPPPRAHSSSSSGGWRNDGGSRSAGVSGGPQRYPKSLLHEFYQRFLGRPIFDTIIKSLPPDEPHFVCRLTCPAVVGDSGRCFSEQIFTGEGRNKRAAEHAAASAALAFIDSLGMLAPAPRPQMQPPPTMVSEAPVTAEEVRMLQQKLAGLGQPTVSMPIGMRSADAGHGAASSSTTSPPASSAGGYHPGGSNFTPSPLLMESQVNLDHMPREVLVATLRESVMEIHSLRQKLAAERDLRYRAISLLSQGG